MIFQLLFGKKLRLKVIFLMQEIYQKLIQKNLKNYISKINKEIEIDILNIMFHFQKNLKILN